jgi:CheY-like chemotaxis protein
LIPVEEGHESAESNYVRESDARKFSVIDCVSSPGAQLAIPEEVPENLSTEGQHNPADPAEPAELPHPLADLSPNMPTRKLSIPLLELLLSGTGTGTRSDSAPQSDCGSDEGRDHRRTKKPKYHVLVVDDSSLSRRMLCKALAAINCTSEEAEDGLEAVEKVSRTLPVVKVTRTTAEEIIAAKLLTSAHTNSPGVGTTGARLGGDRSLHAAAAVGEIGVIPQKSLPNSVSVPSASGVHTHTGRFAMHPSFSGSGLFCDAGIAAPSPLARSPPFQSFKSYQSASAEDDDINMVNAGGEEIMSTAHLEDGNRLLHGQYDSAVNTPLPRDVVRMKALNKRRDAVNPIDPASIDEGSSLPSTGFMTGDVLDPRLTKVPDGKTTVNGTACVVPTYDFILCDSVMPRMDGPTAVKKIRELGYTQPIFGTSVNCYILDNIFSPVINN